MDTMLCPPSMSSCLRAIRPAGSARPRCGASQKWWYRGDDRQPRLQRRLARPPSSGSRRSGRPASLGNRSRSSSRTVERGANHPIEAEISQPFAIAGELIRSRRKRWISAMRSAGMPCRRTGLELQSSSAISPPFRPRRTHLRTYSPTQKSAATLTILSLGPTWCAISSRPPGGWCPVRASLWMFIRGLGFGC